MEQIKKFPGQLQQLLQYSWHTVSLLIEIIIPNQPSLPAVVFKNAIISFIEIYLGQHAIAAVVQVNGFIVDPHTRHFVFSMDGVFLWQVKETDDQQEGDIYD